MASTARIFGSRCRVLMAAAKSAAAIDKSTPTSATGRKTVRVTGILKVQTVSPALAKFIGSPETSRSGAIKKIWEYVKSHNLQIYCASLAYFVGRNGLGKLDGLLKLAFHEKTANEGD